MVYLYCQNCEFTKEVADKYLGTKGKCPQCDEQAEALSSIPNNDQNDDHTTIDDLEVSKSWKAKFKTLERIGAKEQFITKATTSAEFKSLSFKEKQQVNFNIWAMFFGPIYYLVKKMWLKGALLWGGIILLNTLLSILEILTGFTFPSVFYWLPGNIICAQLVNYDYYRYVVHNEKIWTKLTFFSKPLHLATFIVLSLLLLFSVSLISSSSAPDCNDSEVTDLVLQITEDTLKDSYARQSSAGKYTYNQIQLMSKNNSKIKPILDDINKRITDVHYAVTSIRTQSANDEIKKTECAASLAMTGEAGKKSIPITYNAQYTDNDGQLYVNVFGL